jgi:hypothetical protein
MAFERLEYLLNESLSSIVGTVSELCSKLVAQYYMDTPSLNVMVRQLILHKINLVFELLLLCQSLSPREDRRVLLDDTEVTVFDVAYKFRPLLSEYPVQLQQASLRNLVHLLLLALQSLN